MDGDQQKKRVVVPNYIRKIQIHLSLNGFKSVRNGLASVFDVVILNTLEFPTDSSFCLMKISLLSPVLDFLRPSKSSFFIQLHISDQFSRRTNITRTNRLDVFMFAQPINGNICERFLANSTDGVKEEKRMMTRGHHGDNQSTLPCLMGGELLSSSVENTFYHR